MSDYDSESINIFFKTGYKNYNIGLDDKFKINEGVFNNFIEITKDKGAKGSSSEIETSKDWINMRLKALIARHQWSDEGFYRAMNKDDRMIIKALDVLNETTQY